MKELEQESEEKFTRIRESKKKKIEQNKEQIFASKYKTVLPTEEELAELISSETRYLESQNN